MKRAWLVVRIVAAIPLILAGAVLMGMIGLRGGRMKITIARLGPPADHNGTVVAPGAIPACSVPLCEDFDPMLRPIGRVTLAADGSGDLELLEGVELETEKLVADATIGLAYRVLEQHEDGGVRVIDRLEVFAVGVSRDLIKRGPHAG